MPLKPKFNSYRRKIFAGFLLASFANGQMAYAASCCAGSGGQIFLVLPSEQRYQLGLSTAYRVVDGHFDPYGDYRSIGDGDSTETYSTSFGAAFRLSESWQLGFALPLIHNRNEFSGATHTATSMGDPVIETRYRFWEDLRFLPWRPQVALYGGIRAPLAKSMEESTDPYNTDAIGDGGYTAHMGINISKILHPMKFELDGSFLYPFERDIDQMRGLLVSPSYGFRPGNKFQLAESLGYLPSEHWSTTIGLKQLWILESEKNGRSVSGSAGRFFSSLLGMTYFYDASWSLGLSYETALPFYGYAANQANAQTASLTVTYGGF
jgi:hypothetical protein